MRQSSWVLVLNVSTGKILLGKRAEGSNNPGQWNFFGGGVEDKEKLIRAAQRELKEEFGLKVKKDDLVKIGSLKNSKTKYLMHYYLLALSFKPAKDKINQDEIERVKWFDIKNLPKNLHLPTKFFFKSKLFKIIKDQLKQVQASRIETTAAVNYLSGVYSELGQERAQVHQVLAELPDGVSLSQVMEVFEPIIENYRSQIDGLKNELNWTYEQLDENYTDYIADLTSGIENYRGALQALDTYTPSWFAELPVSYERLTEIAGLLRSQLLLFINERDLPAHFSELLAGNYDAVISFRSSEPIDEFDQETEDSADE